MESTTAIFDHIPDAILRAGYEAERAAWQAQLAQMHARLRAQQHIGNMLHHDNAAYIATLIKDMELLTIGLEMIAQMIMALPPDSVATNGKENHA